MQRDVERPDTRERGGVSSLLIRIYWMLFGVIPVVVFTSQIVAAGANPTWADVRYWAGLLALIAARWLDQARFAGTRADGSVATQRDLYRYALVVLVSGSLVYLAARLVASRS